MESRGERLFQAGNGGEQGEGSGEAEESVGRCVIALEAFALGPGASLHSTGYCIQ